MAQVAHLTPKRGDGVVSGDRGVTPFTRDTLGIASCDPGSHLTPTSPKRQRQGRICNGLANATKNNGPAVTV